MIVIAIIGILIAVAIPSYQSYTRRAHYTEIVAASEPYKIGVEECFQINGVLDACDAGSNGIPQALGHNEHPGLVETVDVQQGVIRITPKTQHGFTASDNYILTPQVSNNSLNWHASGGAIDRGYAHR